MNMYMRVFGCSVESVIALEHIYNDSKINQKQSGLSLEEFTKALKIDKFWTERLFKIISYEFGGARISLRQFIYFCILMKPVQSERTQSYFFM